MDILTENIAKLKETPFKTAYKIFSIKNGKIYTKFVGKHVNIPKTFFTTGVEGKDILVYGTTTPKQKKRLRKLDSIIYNNEHIGYISAYLNFGDIIKSLYDKNSLVAVVRIPNNCKVKIGENDSSEKIILSEKISIRYFLKRTTDSYFFGFDCEVMNKKELQERIKKSIIKKN